MSKRPDFDLNQEYWLSAEIDHWYFEWKRKITDPEVPHMLGIAKEQLKQRLAGYPIDRRIENIVNEKQKE
jgi:hypothetical protein